MTTATQHTEQSQVRLQAARERGYNGIEYIHVLDRELEGEADPAETLRQRVLLVHCIRLVPFEMAAEQVEIEGGVRIRNIEVVWAFSGLRMVDAGDPEVTAVVDSDERDLLEPLLNAEDDLADILVVRTDARGDFSPYTLTLSDPPVPEGEVEGEPLQDDPHFEPTLASLSFSFKVECPTDFDCKADVPETVERLSTPHIDYLSKDYASFRRLMLDRLALTMPGWTEQNVADVGMAVVEVLAYAADHLSYYQDAVATEAYLNTARRRISVRRHARLLDYRVHEGCNARAWVHIQVSPGSMTLDRGTQLLTRVVGQGARIQPDSIDYTRALAQEPEVFETMHDATLRQAHNRISLYAWGE